MKNSESPTLMFGKYQVDLTKLSQARPPTRFELEELFAFEAGGIDYDEYDPIVDYEATATVAFSYVAVFDYFRQYDGYEGKMMVVVDRVSLHHPDTYIWKNGRMEKMTPDKEQMASSRE